MRSLWKSHFGVSHEIPNVMFDDLYHTILLNLRPTKVK